MALFRSKKKTDEKVKTDTVVVPATTHRSVGVTSLLRGPRITEKASRLVEQNIYVFNVTAAATKKSIAFAVEDRYNVRPVQVRVVPIKSKKVISRGKKGTAGGGKKAYVYLASGQTIQLT